MANKRMISKQITSSIEFLEMSTAAQALYLHANAESDDDGITEIETMRRLMRARKSAIAELIENSFITMLDTGKGVAYINEWHRFNHIGDYRGTPSRYRNALLEHFPDIENVLFKPKTEQKSAQKSGQDSKQNEGQNREGNGTEKNGMPKGKDERYPPESFRLTDSGTVKPPDFKEIKEILKRLCPKISYTDLEELTDDIVKKGNTAHWNRLKEISLEGYLNENKDVKKHLPLNIDEWGKDSEDNHEQNYII